MYFAVFKLNGSWVEVPSTKCKTREEANVLRDQLIRKYNHDTAYRVVEVR